MRKKICIGIGGLLLFALAAFFIVRTIYKQPVKAQEWSEFAEAFEEPDTEYRPKVRWWWPGGDVEEEELIREIEVLHENGFGGVEIQPFDYSLKDEATSDPDSPVKDITSDAFFDKIKVVLDAARERNMTVDLNMGSGYCAGASFVPLEDNEQTLMPVDITVNQDQVNTAIPTLGESYPYELFEPGSENSVGNGWKTMNYHPETAKLVMLLAAKVISGERNPDYKVLNDTVELDLTSVEKITDFDSNTGTFNWTCPDTSSSWQIIAVY